MINAVIALLCGGAVFAYLVNVCNCGFGWQQWTFVSAAALGVAAAVWIFLAVVRGIARLLFRGRRAA